MRLIDADEAIKDAELNYSKVYDTPLMKYFLEKQPTVKTIDSGSEGCEACINKYCVTCVYQGIADGYEPCLSCEETHEKYRQTNYCSECGKLLIKKD